MAEILWTEEAKPMSEADKIGRLYQILRQRDEDRKFRKTIDPRQVTLEQAIAKAERKLKNV